VLSSANAGTQQLTARGGCAVLETLRGNLPLMPGYGLVTLLTKIIFVLAIARRPVTLRRFQNTNLG
jgi:hypothetical protein